ncbi:ABC transporter permease subunit [Limimaricola litoreus]|uniref:Maltose/maltodextrin transport system permease protein MalG n=1 Tax=Limimaricola litoreus TaxID=2955316 RepID=A0A9X2FP33_9RHOB|nr:ABC transporter permease subunit [Limimaricola litoreus]MCP1167570.1 ABC transporter permease subunit [Limimaricola litoreus]
MSISRSTSTLPEKFQQAAATGGGPDIVMFAHDRLGKWATDGIIAPVTPGAGFADGILPAAMEAVTFDGADKAAEIDGASPWRTFRHLFLPLAVPIMAVIFVPSFIGVINDYPIASVLIRSEDQMTLAVGSRLYLNEFKYHWGDFAAAAILSGLPITGVFLIARRHLVSGLSDGAVKG